ncbi:hypothetical protein Ddye_030426 [Dipteronia dyeriana]|uniref:Uncharacterized protein n=1 Tax=Dipteronia dyeriana TaxID=168575 RepID=A0AAD9TGA6_9ROSI|nr:hypothetical protein Ddye_030426 [Dipteronia dyeriana]
MKLVKPLTLYKELRKRKSKQGRLLGLELSEKYVNLAVSDPDNDIVVPLRKYNMDFMADKFQSLGKKIFLDELCKTGKFDSLKYAFWNKLIATKHMDFQLKHHLKFVMEYFNLPEDKSKEFIDRCIAARILQRYLYSYTLTE